VFYLRSRTTEQPARGSSTRKERKNTYIDEVGERPSDYDDVREWFAAHENAQTTLFDY
jgi:hypothetical protein